jgi:hypothetical protein
MSRFLASQTIALEASDSNTTFYVHEHLLRSISPVLLAAISREWNEKTTGRYKFHEEVPEKVLLCFLRWAYHGNYHEIIPSSVNLKAENDEEFYTWIWGVSGKKKKKKKKKGLFEEPEPEPEPAPEPPPEPEEDGPVEEHKQMAEQTVEGSLRALYPEDNLHPLLLNIKLYVFADAYMIEPLKTLSKQKMMAQLQELGNLANGHERDAVFDVLTFAFSSRLPEQDVLLHWLARYASWRLDELKQMSSSFDKLLLETEGNFATLLVRYVEKSSLDPFNLKTEEIMPRYPIPISRC